MKWTRTEFLDKECMLSASDKDDSYFSLLGNRKVASSFGTSAGLTFEHLQSIYIGT